MQLSKQNRAKILQTITKYFNNNFIINLKFFSIYNITCISLLMPGNNDAKQSCLISIPLE